MMKIIYNYDKRNRQHDKRTPLRSLRNAYNNEYSPNRQKRQATTVAGARLTRGSRATSSGFFVKEEKLGGVLGGECKSGDEVEGLLARESRSLDILSAKKEAKESASEVPGVVDGKGDEDFR